MKVLGKSIIGLLFVIGSIFTMTAAQAQVDGPVSGEVAASPEQSRLQKAARAYTCNVRHISFKKVDGDRTDWWAGRIRVNCNRIALRIEVQPVITRAGGGAPARTYYKRPAKVCSQVATCVATFKVRDIGGRQEWSLQQNPEGTRAHWAVGTNGVSYDCHDRTKFYCPKPTIKFG